MPDAARLFRDHPPGAPVRLSTGAAPTPYAVQEAEAAMILGAADMGAAQAAMAAEGVHPVAAGPGRAAMGLILCDFSLASLGPHAEAQLFTLCADAPGVDLGPAGMAMPVALGLRAEISIFCLHLWNDLPAAVAYNSEYLGLQARRARCKAGTAEGAWRFSARDAEAQGAEARVAEARDAEAQDAEGAPILDATVADGATGAGRAFLEILRLAGPVGLWRLASAPYTRTHVVNRRGPVMAENRRAPIRMAPGKVISRPWDPGRDRLDLHAAELSGYGFAPRAVQRLRRFRFVYLHPDAA